MSTGDQVRAYTGGREQTATQANTRKTMEQVIQIRARRRRVSRHVRRAPLRRGFDEPFEEEERELVLGGGDDKPAGE
jgi:hypothetical protein